jgi:hypothetical protein
LVCLEQLVLLVQRVLEKPSEPLVPLEFLAQLVLQVKRLELLGQLVLLVQ